MLLNQYIESLVSTKSFCTWQDAAQVTGQGKFLPSKIPTITKMFRDARAGSDALIVNSAGRYGRAELVERHTSFLKAHGYTKIPEFVAKKASVPTCSVTAPETSEIAELKAQVAMLMKLLAK